jgi:hypothetical protein
MIRLLVFLPEILIGLGVYFELIRPIWKGTKLFPITRAFGRGILRLVPKTTAAEQLEASSKRRLIEAARRKRAAQADTEAVRLETEAERLEDEANRIRMGESKSEE